MNNLFQSILIQTQTETPSAFFICLTASIILGVIMAVIYGYKTRTTRSFLAAYALLPAAVCAVIMMVNGNVGTGVAVAGAFGLVRFRSVPGTAKEIGSLFIAMGAGLMCGMGYIAYAFCFGILLSVCSLVLFGAGTDAGASVRQLIITIPEDLDYEGLFEGILSEYTKNCTLAEVKTTGMGSLYRLTYEVTLKKEARTKEMIDRLRRENGNLEIKLTREQLGGQL